MPSSAAASSWVTVCTLPSGAPTIARPAGHEHHERHDGRHGHVDDVREEAAPGPRERRGREDDGDAPDETGAKAFCVAA